MASPLSSGASTVWGCTATAAGARMRRSAAATGTAWPAAARTPSGQISATGPPVTVVAGVAAITSAFPELSRHAISLSVGSVVLLTVMNLRGVKESGKAFAVPTYGFLLGIYAMFAVAGYRLLSGQHLLAPTAGLPIHPEHSYVGIALVLL